MSTSQNRFCRSTSCRGRPQRSGKSSPRRANSSSRRSLTARIKSSSFSPPVSAETAPDAVAGAGPGDHETHFGLVEQRAVVEIDGELEGEERADRRVSLQDRENGFKRLGIGDPGRGLVTEHPVHQVKVVAVLPFVSESRTGDDVGAGVHRQVSREQIVEDLGISVGVEMRPQ